MLAMLGASFIFTAYATVALFLVHTTAHYVFYLALAAHVQLFSILAGFVAQLVKRRVSAGKEGVSIVDEGVQVDPTITVTPVSTGG